MDWQKPDPTQRLSFQTDLTLSGLIFIITLATYTAALAPDVLYSDSAEFQTLAYTGGMTHPTGYPVYILLARLVGSVPLNTLAWRINWFSAWGGALTVAGVYLLARRFTTRGGALIASAVLLVAPTFWTQSIIAEVYTPATALLVVILLMLIHWNDTGRSGWLFGAAFLASLGVGLHLFFISAVGPAALVYIALRNQWRQTLVWGAVGTLSGLLLVLLVFLLFDAQPTLTSYFSTSLDPSRSAWGRPASALDDPLERIWFSISGQQWQDRLLPADYDLMAEWATFFTDLLSREFSGSALVLAIVGVIVAFNKQRRKSLLVLLTMLTNFLLALAYDPGDKFVFFLPTYVILAVFVGVGAGHLTSWLTHWLPFRKPSVVTGMMLGLVTLVTIGPVVESRWQAIQTGRSNFSDQHYVYPVADLSEPRRVAECVLTQVAEPDAYLVIQWRALYSVYYVAHVERSLTDLHIVEARPYGTTGLAESLQEDIAAMLTAGRHVYVDELYPELQQAYRLEPVGAACADYPLFELAPPDK